MLACLLNTLRCNCKTCFNYFWHICLYCTNTLSHVSIFRKHTILPFLCTLAIVGTFFCYYCPAQMQYLRRYQHTAKYWQLVLNVTLFSFRQHNIIFVKYNQWGPKNVKIRSEAITRFKSTNQLMYNTTPLNFHWTIPLSSRRWAPEPGFLILSCVWSKPLVWPKPVLTCGHPQSASVFLSVTLPLYLPHLILSWDVFKMILLLYNIITIGWKV